MPFTLPGYDSALIVILSHELFPCQLFHCSYSLWFYLIVLLFFYLLWFYCTLLFYSQLYCCKHVNKSSCSNGTANNWRIMFASVLCRSRVFSCRRCHVTSRQNLQWSARRLCGHHNDNYSIMIQIHMNSWVVNNCPLNYTYYTVMKLHATYTATVI